MAPLVVAVSCLLQVTSSSAAEFQFGLGLVDVTESTTSAAEHPDFNVAFELDQPISISNARTKDVEVELPSGFYGNPAAVPRCSTGDFEVAACPIDSQVGIANVLLNEQGKEKTWTFPFFNLEPPHPEAEVARFGFIAVNLPVFINVSVRTAGDYGVSVKAPDLPGLKSIAGSETILWGNPADPSHDKLRMTQQEAIDCNGTACKAPGGERESGIPPEQRQAFMTNPSACQQGEAVFRLTSYQLPGQVFSKNALMAPIVDCEGIPFAPTLETRPTTDVAAAPTGLHAVVKIPQNTDPGLLSTAPMSEAKVTLPEGMVINPSAANGLTACSDEQVHFHEEVDAQCPDASKLGSVKVVTPLLSRPLEGSVYQRSPQPGRLFGLWLVVDELGLHMKIPGEAQPDPRTGQLTAVFSNLPQLPVEEIDLEIWGGPTAPLKNPDVCGRYETTAVFDPWSSDPPATPADRFLIDRGPDGGACPGSAAEQRNSPAFEAGTLSPIAGIFSPVVARLHREDGSQAFGSLDLTLPPGLVAKLAGVAECQDAALAAAAAKSGTDEKANPSCPASSLIGTVNVAAGAGPSPFWVQSNAYLAGPYKGAPLSVAIVAPAVAGPFDLGTVVSRTALYVDPETARVTAKTDPLPTILQGVPLNLRTVAVRLDRDQFTLNGTSCEPLAFSGSLISTLGNAASLSAPYQMSECARLGFKPKLSLKLKGGTKRAQNPAFHALLRMPPSNQANIARVVTTLPHSAFLDQSHIRTICTRVQFAAGAGDGANCPKGSVYGRAKAWTPILDKPLEGPVFLRSSTHPLPDLVVALRGRLDVALVGRVDSRHGGIRISFEGVPDAPATKFVLNMQGGKKGLIVNSRNLCFKPGRSRATVSLAAQNGRRSDLRPAVEASSCKKGKRHRGARKHG